MQVKILSGLIALLILVNAVLIVEINIRYEEVKYYHILNKEFVINDGYYCELQYTADSKQVNDTVDLMLYYNIFPHNKYKVKEYSTPLGRVVKRKIELKCEDCYYPYR